jgi:hypothetical protein
MCRSAAWLTESGCAQNSNLLLAAHRLGQAGYRTHSSVDWNKMGGTARHCAFSEETFAHHGMCLV